MMLRGLLDEVLAYCDAHPHEGPLPDAGVLTMRRDNGIVTVDGDIPDAIDISPEFLDSDRVRGVDFADGVLTFDVAPRLLRYRPLGKPHASWAIRFQRIHDEPQP